MVSRGIRRFGGGASSSTQFRTVPSPLNGHFWPISFVETSRHRPPALLQPPPCKPWYRPLRWVHAAGDGRRRLTDTHITRPPRCAPGLPGPEEYHHPLAKVQEQQGSGSCRRMVLVSGGLVRPTILGRGAVETCVVRRSTHPDSYSECSPGPTHHPGGKKRPTLVFSI